jgi:hypothetical protein
MTDDEIARLNQFANQYAERNGLSMADDNPFRKGEWRDGQFYPCKSQADMGPTEAEKIARQWEASGWVPSADDHARDRGLSAADQELLTLAARAAGLMNPQYEQAVAGNWNIYYGDESDPRECWNPLTDDGDALRLAVKLGLQVTPPSSKYPFAFAMEPTMQCAAHRVDDVSDPMSATRRVIVLAAAEIGKQRS